MTPRWSHPISAGKQARAAQEKDGENAMRPRIHLFHFESSDHPVNGSPWPYVIGFDDQLGVYMSEPDALAAESADRLQDVFIDVLRRADLDDNKHVTHLLQGKHPCQFKIGEQVNDGGTNPGTYAGLFDVELPEKTITVVPVGPGGWTFRVTSSRRASAIGSRGQYASEMDAVRAARRSHAGANVVIQRLVGSAQAVNSDDVS
jgi:hypothetical protein